MAKTIEKGPTLNIKRPIEAAFARRAFSIHSMSFQKAGNFSKIISLPRSWLSRLVKSNPELPRINTGKRTANKEITPGPYSKALNFTTGTQNDTSFVPLESRHFKLSGNIKFS
jgi:hypothetical protein